MQSSTFTVQVPATTANLGPGFDTFGIALPVYNRFRVEFLEPGSADFEAAAQNPLPVVWQAAEDVLPFLTYTADNLILKSLLQILKEYGHKLVPLKITVENEIPLSRGMGSSASVIVGGLFIGREILRRRGVQVDLDTLRFLADRLEGHPDNVTPAIFGGFCFCFGDRPEDYLQRKVDKNELQFLLCIPDYKLSTEKARGVLPGQYPVSDAVANLRAAALWIAWFDRPEDRLLHKALEDRLHQPYRKSLIAEFEPVSRAALEYGSPGAAISGAGPTLLIVLTQQVDLAGLSEAVRQIYSQNGHRVTLEHVAADNLGTVLL